MNDLPSVLRLIDVERRSTSAFGLRVEAIGSMRVHHYGSQHCVAWCNSSPADLDTTVKELIGHYRKWGGSLEWKWYGHDEHAELLAAALERQGFDAGELETVMAAVVSALPDTRPTHVLPVETAGQLSDYQTTAQRIFNRNLDFVVQTLSDAMRQLPRRQFAFLATDTQMPVGIARLFLNPESQFAYLAGGGVLPEYRRRGHYRDMVFARVALARKHGVRYVMSDALPTSRPILQAIGLSPVTITRPYTLGPA